MSSDHMIFLAGRKEYSNHSQRLHSSADLTALAEGSSLQESLERALSTSIPMSIDDVNSVHSFESEASDFSSSDNRTLQRSFSTTSSQKLHNVNDNSEERQEDSNVRENVIDCSSCIIVRLMKQMRKERIFLQNCFLNSIHLMKLLRR